MTSQATDSDSKDSNASTVSFQSTTTVSSTSPLTSRAAPLQKDYAAALSALQSRYGTGGALPSPKAGPSKKLPDSPLASPANSPASSVGGSTPNDSQATLAPSSTGSEGDSSTSGSVISSASTSTQQTRKKSKPKSSILKTLFKGKAKETKDSDA